MTVMYGPNMPAWAMERISQIKRLARAAEEWVPSNPSEDPSIQSKPMMSETDDDDERPRSELGTYGVGDGLRRLYLRRLYQNGRSFESVTNGSLGEKRTDDDPTFQRFHDVKEKEGHISLDDLNSILCHDVKVVLTGIIYYKCNGKGRWQVSVKFVTERVVNMVHNGEILSIKNV